MLKILAGSARGRTILSLSKAPHLRPILARVKKSLFDILTPRMVGCRFLDLFSGTGAVGLEALSRGADQAVFVEQDRGCVRVLKSNLERFGFKNKAQVFAMNVLSGLKPIPGPFDLIFMGPPYKDEEKKALALVGPTLNAIDEAGVLSTKGLIIAQHQKKEEIDLSQSPFDLIRREQYGDTHLSFFKWKNSK